MEKIDDIIELGAASVETKGAVGSGADEILRRPHAGIADD